MGKAFVTQSVPAQNQQNHKSHDRVEELRVEQPQQQVHAAPPCIALFELEPHQHDFNKALHREGDGRSLLSTNTL